MNKPKPVIGIVGTGMIASGMAILATGHGCPAIVLSRSAASTQRFRKTIEDQWISFSRHGLVTPAQQEICDTYLTITEDYQDLADAEIVFECALEDLAIKHAIYKKLEECCPSLQAICSVSSSIVPDLLAEGCDRYKEKVMVAHPFNPVHMVPYFELCGSVHTPDSVIAYSKEILEMLDRKPVILKKPTPGFIGNRLQFALWREALALVEEGICDPRDIDTCLNFSFCPRYTSIGIYEHFDNGGMELNRNICQNVFPILNDRKDVPEIITDLIAEGKTGQRAGQGFYDWREVDMDAYRERVNKPFWQFCEWDFPEEPKK